ncbi:acyl carrier protein [Actinosynnema sp. NPDC023658]|uniref:acyl carrier protein n=1 Tax=Actinosynnema sp. NPDC023658 TaxID=3155465 RepID=UPI0033FBABCB
MKDLDEFIALVGDQLGLPLSGADADTRLDELTGWDSVQLLGLLPVLEERSGRQLSLPDILQATSLEQLYVAVVTA